MTFSGSWLQSIFQPLMFRVTNQLFHGLIAVIAKASDNFMEFIFLVLIWSNLVIVCYVCCLIFMTKTVAPQPSWHS